MIEDYETGYTRGLEDGANEERTAILAFLRAIGDEFSFDDPHRLADLLQEDEHLK
jgi:hypothetical protein